MKRIILISMVDLLLSGCVSMKRYNKDIITVGKVGKLIENIHTLNQITKLEKTEIEKDHYFILKLLLDLRKFELEQELILEGIDDETIKKIEK